MNILTGKIVEIEVYNNLSLVHLDVSGVRLRSIIIDTPASVDYLKAGTEVQILFKETETIIGLMDDLQISLQNRIPCVIESIEVGALLAKVHMQFDGNLITSVITTNAVKQLGLNDGSHVFSYIKTNEVMLAP